MSNAVWERYLWTCPCGHVVEAESMPAGMYALTDHMTGHIADGFRLSEAFSAETNRIERELRSEIDIQTAVAWPFTTKH